MHGIRMPTPATAEDESNKRSKRAIGTEATGSAVAASPSASMAVPTPQLPNGSLPWPAADLEFMSPPQTAAPPFPIGLVPETLRAMIVGFCEARRLSIDYVGVALLVAFAGAIGNRARILTLEGESEPLVLHATLVGLPSTGKSLAITIPEKALCSIEEAMQLEHARITGHRNTHSDGKLESRIRDVVKKRLELEGLASVAIESEKRASEPPAIVLSETTGAGLIEELQNGCDGRILISHELTGALAFGAAYQGLRSRGLILEGYDAKRRTVRTKTDGRIVIPSLSVVILGATQPSRLTKLLGDAGDGFAARMWWIYPDAPSRTKLPTAPGPVAALEDALTRLIAIEPAGESGSSYSALTPLAAETAGPMEAAFDRWDRHAALTDGLYRDFVGRAAQHALRLAGVFAIAEWVASGQVGLPDGIGVEMIDRAIGFVDSYLLPMAERTLSAARSPQESDAVRLARFLARAGNPIVNVRADIHRAAGSPVRAPEAVALAIEELRQRNVIRPIERIEKRLGRPAQSIEVNPALFVWAAKAIR